VLPFRGGAVEVLTAKREGRPPPPSSLLPSVPADLDALCIALLAPAAGDRPSGEAVLKALGGAVPELRSVDRTPFVGRRHQLAQLEDAMLAVRGGRTVAVYVQGNSGMGKSALVETFLDKLRAADPRTVVLQGRCYERESVPYKAVDDLVDGLCHWLRRQQHTEVLSLLPQHISALARVFPVLEQVEAVATVSMGSGERPELQDLRGRAFGALKELLSRIAERHPLVVYIDDLQWGDADSAALLAEVMRPSGQPHMLFVGCFRADETAGPVIGELMRRAAGPARTRVEVREVFLDPLNPDEVRELARALAPDESDITGRAAALARESQGSPFFVAELLRGGAVHDLHAEVSLDEAVWHRVGQLPDDARNLLEVVAAIGQPIQQLVALKAAGLAGAAGDPLALLRTAHFVRTRGPHPRDPVECFHDRIRETVASRLAPERVREIYGRLATVLEGSDDQNAAELLALAIQLGAGHDRERVFSNAVAAAQRAERALAFDRAAALYAMALERAPAEGHRELHRKRADMLAFAGSGAEAAAEYKAAAVGAPEPERLELERLAADNLLRSGHIAEGLVALAEVGAALGVKLPRSRGRAIAALVWQRIRLGMRGLEYSARPETELPARELERLDALFAAATTLGMVDHLRGALLQSHHLLGALALGDEARACRALATEAIFLSVQPRPAVRQRAVELCRDVRMLAERLGDPYLIGGAHFCEGATSFFTGRYRAAHRELREAERILSEEVVGAWWERNTARWFLYMNQISMGDFNGVSALLHRATADAERRNDCYARSLFKGHPLVWCSLRDDRPEEAEAELGSALDGWPERPWYQAHYIVLVSKLMIALYREDQAAAQALIEEARPVIRALMIHRMPFVMGEMHKLAGHVALLAGDHGEVMRRAKKLDAAIATIGRGLGASLRAPLAAQQGKPEEARRILAEAVDLFEDSDSHHLVAASRYRLGQMLGGARGDQYMAQAISWMRGQGICNVERMVRFLMPGFPQDAGDAGTAS
jgi:tetratricopeptide (TPR) repeat protein